MKEIYILKDKKKKRIYTSFMIKPLADLIDKDRRTLKNWMDKPYIAERNDFEIKVGTHIVGLKGNDDVESL
jgi:hypothetical protein